MIGTPVLQGARRVPLAFTSVFRQVMASMPGDVRLAAALAVAYSAYVLSVACNDAGCIGAPTVWRETWVGFACNWASLVCVSVGFSVLSTRGRARVAALFGLCLLAAWVWGTAYRWFMVGHAVVDAYPAAPGAIAFLSPFWQWNLGLAILLVVQREYSLRSRAAAEAMHATELQQIAVQAQASQAQLNLLEAQIEPHFLFNALANVRRLLRTDTLAARRMVGDLLRYFEEALPRLRDPQSTLGREAELVRAFLAVHAVRMGERLRVDLDIPSDLMACELPSMSLLTLVENALKHGLQPIAEGGTIRVAARAADSTLALSVADDGQGMGSGVGHGTGLVNLRARLRAMYGSAATLSLRANEPRGVVATIVLPQAAP